MAENKKEACWYVIHTYSGYENKVKDTLEKSVENNGMQDLILDVRVPMEEVMEIRNGKRVKSTRKVYPGYVLVHMIETSESWYVVRNTRGVTGFVGPDSKPVPLTQEEVDMMLNTEQSSVDFGFAIGENVRCSLAGKCPWKWISTRSRKTTDSPLLCNESMQRGRAAGKRSPLHDRGRKPEASALPHLFMEVPLKWQRKYRLISSCRFLPVRQHPLRRSVPRWASTA